MILAPQVILPPVQIGAVLLTIGYGLLALVGVVLTRIVQRRRRRIWRAILKRAATDNFTNTRLTAGLRRDAQLIFHGLFIRLTLATGGFLLAVFSLLNMLFWRQIGLTNSIAGIYFLFFLYGTEAAWDYWAGADLFYDTLLPPLETKP